MNVRMHFIGLLKTGEHYMFLYDPPSVEELLRQFGRMAADPELSFSWYDAAILTQRIRKLREAA